MGRRATGYWDDRTKRYYARLGPVSPKSGKRKPVMLAHADGRPIAEGDAGAVAHAVRRLLADLDAERSRERAGPTVGDVTVAFVTWHREHSKGRTAADHEYHLVRFGEFESGGARYHELPAADLAVAHLTRYRKHMEARGNQSGYIKLAYASILACWRWAARPVEDREPLRLLASNPFDGLARPKKGKGRRLVLSWPAIQELLAFAAGWVEQPAEAAWHRNRRISVDRHRPLNRLRVLALRLIAECGARPHEAMELRWDWLHEAERVVVIPSEHTKTGKEDRIVGLSPGMAAELARIRASGQVHPIFVFATAGDPRGEDDPPTVHRFDEWFRGLREAAQAAGLAVPTAATPYTLRHSFVSQARAGGIDLRELAPAMGHSADVAESTYAHAQIVEIRELMDRARAARERSGG